MKTKYIIIVNLFTLVFSFSAYSERRSTYWTHGMGGDAGALNEFGNYFSGIYDITKHPTNYNTDQGIVGSAQLLYNEIDSSTNNRNIIIAHSMGGCNSVELWRNHKTGFIGGLITLASPLNGAYIANNIDNGIMGSLSKEVIDKGMKGNKKEPGYIADFIIVSPWVGVISTLCGKKKMYTLTEFLEYVSEKFLASAAADAVQSDLTKKSLKVGSTEIKNIQTSGFDRPSIAFAGQEDSPALLRFVGSRKKTDVVGLINMLHLACYGKYQVHDKMRIAALVCLNFPAAAGHKDLASAWKTSADYWGSGFQQSTDVFIGAYRTEKQTITYQEMVCQSQPNLKSAQVQLPSNSCTNPVLVRKTRTVQVIVTEPNDGIVPYNSQQKLPGCMKIVELLHINHEEMKTHVDVRTQLQKVFDGEIYSEQNRTFFKLTKK